MLKKKDNKSKDKDKGNNKGKRELKGKKEGLWKSLEDLALTEEELHHLSSQEFKSTPLREPSIQASASIQTSSDSSDSPASSTSLNKEGLDRREFLKLMAASMALASTSCLRRPMQKIVPYTEQKEETTLGVGSYYASSWVDTGGVQTYGLLVHSHDGRPIKVEGNPHSPSNGSALSARAQAHILSLYDPERLQGPKRNLFNEKRKNFDSISVKWPEVDAFIFSHLKSAHQHRNSIAFLTGSLASPSTQSLIEEFQRTFEARHISWDPISYEDLQIGQEVCYGQRVFPHFRYDKADYIVSVDADFLGSWGDVTQATRRFSQNRKRLQMGKKTRLVVFDSLYSLTGGNADVRIPIKPSQQLDVVMGMLYTLIVKMKKTSYANHTALRSVLEEYALAPITLGMNSKNFEQMVKDLYDRRGRSLVVAGGTITQNVQSYPLQIAVNFLNHLLENDGRTVDYSQAPFVGHQSSHKDLVRLVADMKVGKIKVLFIHRSNPLYFLSGSSEFADAIKKVPLVIYSGDRLDETGRKADFVLPNHHSMETWGDMEAQKGVYAIQQPTLEPLYDTRSFEQNLLNWIALFRKKDKAEDWYSYLRRQWQRREGWSDSQLEDRWTELLQKGVLTRRSEKEREAHRPSRPFRSEAFQELLTLSPSATLLSLSSPPTLGSEDSQEKDSSGRDGGRDRDLLLEELVLYPKSHMQDGSLANVSWLQELPDNVTKVCWDNYLSISPETAKRHQLKDGSVVELKVKNSPHQNVLRVPVFIQAGQHPQVLALALGYGRTFGGKVATGVGVNAYAIAHLIRPTGDVSVKLKQKKQGSKNTSKDASVYQLQLEFMQRLPALSALPLDWKVVKGAFYPLANVQGHNRLEGRPILHHLSYEEHVKKHLGHEEHKHEEHKHKGYKGEENQHKPKKKSEDGDDSSNTHKEKAHKLWSLWPKHKYKGYRWGMVVDLNTCTGCSACMVACQAENNIPVVGKKYILQGREMHWIRLDRYYSGSEENPRSLFQPMMCQHCENAPCETVCPVLATVHSDEGLNEMVYNRCVGTRYCSNNCPYKVRRFNWFNYTKNIEKPQHMVLNPRVTVRTRGVMEKCTFCVQRIQDGKQKARLDGNRLLQDGEVKTACQQGCPSEAIVFGDLNNSKSRVSQILQKDPRAYRVLEEWNTLPSVFYLSKIHHSEAKAQTKTKVNTNTNTNAKTKTKIKIDAKAKMDAKTDAKAEAKG